MNDGFYWVFNHGEWEIGRCTAGEWFFCGSEVGYMLREVGKVGPKIEPPEGEPKQDD